MRYDLCQDLLGKSWIHRIQNYSATCNAVEQFEVLMRAPRQRPDSVAQAKTEFPESSRKTQTSFMCICVAIAMQSIGAQRGRYDFSAAKRLRRMPQNVAELFHEMLGALNSRRMDVSGPPAIVRRGTRTAEEVLSGLLPPATA